MRYAKFSDYIFESSSERGVSCAPLWIFNLMPELKEWEPEFEDYPVQVQLFNPNTNIYRFRSEDMSISIIADNPNFLCVQGKKIRVNVRICASFFAAAQFIPKSVERLEEGVFRLAMTARGRYYWPFEQKQPTSDWHKMNNRETRKIVNECELSFEVIITRQKNGVTFKVKTSGVDNVPIKIEFAATPDCIAEGCGFSTRGAAGQFVAVKSGDLTLRSGCEVMRITGGFSENNYHATMRGSIPKSPSEFTIYFNGYTHIDRTVSILCERWEH